MPRRCQMQARAISYDVWDVALVLVTGPYWVLLWELRLAKGVDWLSVCEYPNVFI